MDKKILLHIENRFLKGLLLKSIASVDIGILEIIDRDDLKLKLDTFGSSISLALLEITNDNISIVKEEIDCIRSNVPQMPLMAVVSKDTSDIVTFATRSGIKDVMFLPKSKESYRKLIEEKLQPYYDQWVPSVLPSQSVLADFIEQPDLKESMAIEFKHAQRGNYPVTLVMACLTGQEACKAPGFYGRVRTYLRDTDKLLKVDNKAFLGVFPYTQKEYALVLEQKFRRAFEAEFGKPGHHINLYLYSATFPVDEDHPEKILERLKNGINNSMTITSLKVPLNTLSRSELESYKQKIRQYRRFM